VGKLRSATEFCVIASDKTFARGLSWALRLESLRLRYMRGSDITVRGARRNAAAVLIYGFDCAALDDPGYADRECAAIQNDRDKVKIFLQLMAPARHGPVRAEIDRKNQTIEAMARRSGAHMVWVTDLLHSGRTARMTKAGRPNLYGYLSIANAAMRKIKVQSLRSTVRERPKGAKASRSGSQTSSAAAIPGIEQVLAALRWDQPALPATLGGVHGYESLGDFLDGMISFSSYRSWGKFPLGQPIDWSMAGANWTWQSAFNGLDFLRPALSFCYDFLRGHTRRDIENLLRERGVSGADVLARVSFIIGDFVRNNPPTRPANQRAYFQGTICRRVKVLLIFLICFKHAADRGLPLNREEFTLAFQNLFDSFEILRSDETYPRAGNHGVRQDVLFIVAGLLLPKLAYGQELMRLGMDRLQHQQFDRALSKDNVWLENSFGYHCLIMNVLTALAADLRTAKGPAADDIHDVLRRMLPFVEGLIKCNGDAPLIGDTAPRHAFSLLTDVKRELELAEGKSDATTTALHSFARAKDTYYFPDAGYFASHTHRAMDETSSSAIFFANLSTPKHKQSDDLSVVFSRCSRDLLVDGGTYNKEVSDTVRNTARYDPASHNTFRVNGGGYALRIGKGARPAGLDGLWEGDGWAAAQGHNNAYPDARIVRLVIHLKQRHALIVLDRLASKTSPDVLFEQFWHLSPDLAGVPRKGAEPWTFSSRGNGNLLIAFDAEGAVPTLEFGGADNPIAWLMLSEDETVPTPYLRRAMRMKEGVMASFFQSSDRTGDVAVQLVPGSRNGIEIAAKGVDFACRFWAGSDRVECLSLD